MRNRQFVSYIRVSTQRQGKSGLGIEAQRASVNAHVRRAGGSLLCEEIEIESGRKVTRVKLDRALDRCRIHGATLVVAKLDRLARNAAFLMALQDSCVEFVCADIPEANRLTVGILACVAEDESRRISDRTREALAAAKARGTVLGNPLHLSDAARAQGRQASALARSAKADNRAADLQSLLREIHADGATSLRAIAAEFTRRRVPTARGGSVWSAAQVKRTIARMH